MSKGYTVAPWKPIPGSGQSLAVGSGSSSTFTNAVGAITGSTAMHAIALSLAPTATATGALIKISQAGTAATATSDILIKTTDPPLIVAVAPGDKVSAYGLAACTCYLTELSN
ncbi:MAG TPA: hypothetical protein VML56_03590 [Burkholderiales bacterium]|nr:hypothetical protein [Burkholderiales bacterium]HUK32462.1 hypothetical protein [Vicinamibacterales bacterium]